MLPFDKLWRLVEEESRPMELVCVCNTHVSGMPGSHWFAVAYSVKYSLKGLLYCIASQSIGYCFCLDPTGRLDEAGVGVSQPKTGVPPN